MLHPLKATVIKDEMRPNDKYMQDMLCVVWLMLARVVGEEHRASVFGVVCYSKNVISKYKLLVNREYQTMKKSGFIVSSCYRPGNFWLNMWP
jgi:hypothetical protein